MPGEYQIINIYLSSVFVLWRWVDQDKAQRLDNSGQAYSANVSKLYFNNQCPWFVNAQGQTPVLN